MSDEAMVSELNEVPFPGAAVPAAATRPATSAADGLAHCRTARTVWDVLTALDGKALLTHPVRPSHAFVTLPNDWMVSVACSPLAHCSNDFVAKIGAAGASFDIMGRGGSPEGWFDTMHDAEVAIVQPDGRWYRCLHQAEGRPGVAPSWGYVCTDALERLLTRLVTQPAGCLCPACNP